MKNNPFSEYITGTSEWIPIQNLPSDKTTRFNQMCEDGTVGCYVVALKEHTDEIDKAGYISDKVGYIGMSNNIVSRTNSIRATVVSKKNCVYHGLGTYIKNRLDEIPLDRYVVKYLYCEESKSNNFENTMHNMMKEKFGYAFAWREASGGKDGKLERIYNDLTQIDDDSKLQVYENLLAELPDILLRQYHAKLNLAED
jgi:hypothetical protein